MWGKVVLFYLLCSGGGDLSCSHCAGGSVVPSLSLGQAVSFGLCGPGGLCSAFTAPERGTTSRCGAYPIPGARSSSVPCCACSEIGLSSGGFIVITPSSQEGPLSSLHPQMSHPKELLRSGAWWSWLEKLPCSQGWTSIPASDTDPHGGGPT